jgi:hypothetical protein
MTARGDQRCRAGARSSRAGFWQIYRRLNAPSVHILDKPVYKSTPVVNDLTVDSHLRVLNACDERPRWRHVDLEPFEPDDDDFPRDLFDRLNESLGIGSCAAMRPMHEARSQPFADRGDVARRNCRGELSRRLCYFVRVVHDHFTFAQDAVDSVADVVKVEIVSMRLALPGSSDVLGRCVAEPRNASGLSPLHRLKF